MVSLQGININKLFSVELYYRDIIHKKKKKKKQTSRIFILRNTQYIAYLISLGFVSLRIYSVRTSQTLKALFFYCILINRKRLTKFLILAVSSIKHYANSLRNVSEISSRIPMNNRQQRKQKSTTREEANDRTVG